MLEFLQDLGWVALLCLGIGLIGFILIALMGIVLPKLLNKMTTKVDEEKEIAQGNVAVATYFGKVVASCIIALSLIVSTSIVAAVLIYLK